MRSRQLFRIHKFFFGAAAGTAGTVCGREKALTSCIGQIGSSNRAKKSTLLCRSESWRSRRVVCATLLDWLRQHMHVHSPTRAKKITRLGMKRLLPLTVVILGVMLLVVFFEQCRRGGGSTYQTVVATRGPITQVVTATGTLNPVVNVQVGSQVSGNIQKLFADFNSQVKAGQVIAQIDPAIFQADVTQAEGDLANARAGLQLAQVNAARTQSLVAKQNSAQSELDQAMATLHQAQAAVKIKEGALEKAKVDLDHCTITSPIDG